ncbi:hypothetical protein [Pseudalkalibacillus caeni]|uniref:Uncharacterized protein n=1 Tax=Exobacillus caeni TaxID=2574798 RepID=A0A5R9F434_9BACL|nr:hypothetical protein [Pseudalkalibacillus caeni]TLS37761.1 hypothetical protein FCL54_08035 [Pseudalkalibacillus caeni]
MAKPIEFIVRHSLKNNRWEAYDKEANRLIGHTKPGIQNPDRMIDELEKDHGCKYINEQS